MVHNGLLILFRIRIHILIFSLAMVKLRIAPIVICHLALAVAAGWVGDVLRRQHPIFHRLFFVAR